jgi:hypothetical protein
MNYYKCDTFEVQQKRKVHCTYTTSPWNHSLCCILSIEKLFVRAFRLRQHPITLVRRRVAHFDVVSTSFELVEMFVAADPGWNTDDRISYKRLSNQKRHFGMELTNSNLRLQPTMRILQNPVSVILAADAVRIWLQYSPTRA